MNPTVINLLAAIDAGFVPPQEAENSIRQAGGLTYIMLNLALS